MKILNNDGRFINAEYMFDKFYALTCGERGRGRKLGFIGLSNSIQDELKNKNNKELAKSYEVTKNMNGNFIIKEGLEKGLILVTNWYGGYRGGIESNINELAENKDIEILAQGETAEGDAGRMGGENQYIIKIINSCKIKYEKLGRVYGEPRKWIIECNIEKETIKEYEEESEIDLDVI